jgi:hypothetical protein
VTVPERAFSDSLATASHQIVKGLDFFVRNRMIRHRDQPRISLRLAILRLFRLDRAYEARFHQNAGETRLIPSALESITVHARGNRSRVPFR